LGNLDAVRDWGYAPEYVEAMWLMLQTDTPQDFVVATGSSTTVKEFVQYSFDRVGLDWEKHVKFDERYLRPTEVDALIGDATKSREVLGWSAQTTPKELAELMVDSDLAALDARTSHWVDPVAWRY
jgi:GDPmannose 4,6-dehydratase